MRNALSILPLALCVLLTLALCVFLTLALRVLLTAGRGQIEGTWLVKVYIGSTSQASPYFADLDSEVYKAAGTIAVMECRQDEWSGTNVNADFVTKIALLVNKDITLKYTLVNKTFFLASMPRPAAKRWVLAIPFTENPMETSHQWSRRTFFLEFTESPY